MVSKKKKNLPKKVDIAKIVKQSEEISKTINILRNNKKVYFQIYDGLKGFELIMSIIWKDEIVESFILYMKNKEESIKNYAQFIWYLSKNNSKELIDKLEEIYNGILEKYDSIDFGMQASHFWTEEIYLRETLKKIKGILKAFWKPANKNNILNKINFWFLSKNTNLNFSFCDSDLENIDFYNRLSQDIDDEDSSTNLLPFFHLLNKHMDELIQNQERAEELAKDFISEIIKNIEILEISSSSLEKKHIENTKKDIKSFIQKKENSDFNEFSDEIQNILQVNQRNKDLPQSILKKDIETLENSRDELEALL